MVDLVQTTPSAQNVLDLFAGDWTSSMPAGSGITSTGTMPLFEDARIAWLEQALGPVSGKKILELGPLEGAHTYALHKLGADSITAIEANPRAFLRCLCVKEIFDLHRAKFLLGSFTQFLETSESKYDIVVASGVVYHMTDPLRLLDRLCRATDRLFIWSHYYDADVIKRRGDAATFARPASIRFDDYTCDAAVRRYPAEALAWQGFTGGGDHHALWLTREGLLGFLRHRGFSSIAINFDHPDHPNGPALALAARRG